jgi:hypothetical protein
MSSMKKNKKVKPAAAEEEVVDYGVLIYQECQRRKADASALTATLLAANLTRLE